MIPTGKRSVYSIEIHFIPLHKCVFSDQKNENIVFIGRYLDMKDTQMH